ncbi:MAG TPA: methylmalonyl-CoA mutase family protein [Candidatus Polarisedimenticolaceae bacterium]|nr:methylmalonyl-CoA mutase family protein [Candidatus Polarisedimenticolaceae bacterium]
MAEDAARRDWERAVAEALARAPERVPRFTTSSDIEVARVYGPEDLPAFTPARDLGFPGRFPFTRGVQPTMYRSRFWTMRQYSGFGTAEETNRRFHYLLERGQTGLSVAFDLPTQMGYDSDHPVAQGEVGKVGVAISTLEDMETLLRDIPLDRVSTSMTINATAPILLALYVAVARKRGVDLTRLSGTVQNDLLKEYVARGTYIYPPAASLRLTTDLFAWCADALPRWNTISISGYHMREAGATAVQEVAFTLANALAYCQAASERGLPFERFGARLSFFFNGHSNFFEEAAKFRAARRLWARLVAERFGVRDPELQKLRFHTQTAGSSLTAQQPEVNVVRTALQALSAVLGGTQSLHTNAMDEALGLPTEAAARLALRTQQVIAHETGVADTVDPLAGSYFVESLTDAVETGARAYLEKIDAMGGAVRAIERGFQQREIHEAAFRWQRAVESGEATVVGVNRFLEGDEARPPVLRVDETLQARRSERLAAIRARRDRAEVESALRRVHDAAGSEANLLPPILEAVEAEATLGEIADRLRVVFGTHQEAFSF